MKEVYGTMRGQRAGRFLADIAMKHDVRSPCEVAPMSEEFALTLYSEALAEQERQLCPRRGVATDRRALLHLGATFKGENVKTLMLCACSSKRTCHEGFEKFGVVQQKGDVSY